MTLMPALLNNGLADMETVSGSSRVMLDEESFQSAIAFERKRTERSARPFLLMLIDTADISGKGTAREVLAKALPALSVCIRETDVIGWYKSPTVIGVMFTEIGANGGGCIPSILASRVKGTLYESLPFEHFNQISLSYQIFPEKWVHDVPLRPSNPVFYPDLGRRERGKRAFKIGKRFLDLFGSVVAMILFAPVFFLVALAIKLSSKGPVFFKQIRVGQNGASFVFLKFRTMQVNNNPNVHKEFVQRLIKGGAASTPSNSKEPDVYKLTRDPRVTRVGSILRRTSLDELPQLINVLKGEMSLVGPRPAIPYEVEAYEIWHRSRVLETKPGITGLWQVKGRSSVRFDEMVRLDVRYAMACSLWLDLKILFLTPRAVIMGEGAY